MAKDTSHLDELLEILEEVRDEEIDRTTISGLACSRTTTDLHLAVGTGVIAVPIADIDEVTPLGIDNPRTVSVTVKSADAVRWVRRPPALSKIGSSALRLAAPASLRTSLGVLQQSGDIEWPPIYGPGVSTQFCVTTTTDGNACDDFECEVFDDDLGQ